MDDCLTERFHIVDNFLTPEGAEAMRADIDRHFGTPDNHGPDHQVWNYWHVPDHYTYLRAAPERVIAKAKVDGFVQALQRWAAVNLGFAKVTWPWLSLYVPGCEQVLHNDSENGRMGYVFSLTRNDRKTIGGETIVLGDSDLFRTNLDNAAAGTALFERIPPDFNRLVLFDDRVPHAVRRLEGPMDPLEGRFVLHGHLSEAGAIAQGGLHASAVRSTVDQALVNVRQSASRTIKGPLVLSLTISAHGSVDGVRALVDRLASSQGEDTAALRRAVIEALSVARFPAAESRTSANVPLLF